jgi:hypothetical protein
VVVGVGVGPLRILLTMTADRQHAALGVAIDRWIDQLERRSAGQVLVRRVRVTAGYQQLLRVFRQVLSPFHLWQHVGPCAPGLDLELGKERVQVCDLNMLLAEQPAACCMVLATHAQAPPASVLSQLQAPFVLWQSARPGRAEDLELLHGFYTRLLTHDLAVAATLGQLETCTQGGSEGVGGSLSLLARTTHLFAGPPRLARLRRPRTQAQAQLPRATLLVLKANPPVEMSAMVGLRIEQEVNQIRGVLRENSGMVDLREAGAVRLPDLSRYLQRYLPVLLHFSGHGTPEEELVLEKYTSPEELQGGMYLSAVEAAAYVAYVDIARILVAYSATLRCVVFNACSTESLAEAICLQIPCAIGMRGPINDFLAIRFAEIFYRSLAAGESVGLAFRKAHSDILSGPHAKRAEIFQLKSRSGVNPDEIFLVAGRGGRV